MRLIDADKVKEYIRTEGFYCDNQADKEYTVNRFDELFPTVKAIPIEWIKEHYGWLTMAGEIIKEWEAESGANK